jgi:lipid-binding SYLF domain-containing protein
MKYSQLFIAAVWAMGTTLHSADAGAQSKAAIDSGVAQTLDEFTRLDSRHTPLLHQASGVLVFPMLVKGGIGLANEYGAGALQIGGVTTGYYSMISASVGLTAGMSSHAEVILFMTPAALAKFAKSPKWSFGADAGIAVIDKGTAGDYDTLSLKKPVLRFVFDERGLMADVSFSGTKIVPIHR